MDDKGRTSGLDLAVELLLEFQSQLKVARTIVEWASRQEPCVEETTYEEAKCPGCYASFGVLGDYDWDEEVANLEHEPDCPVMKARQWLFENPA